MARGCAVKHRVAREHIATARSRQSRTDGNRSAGQSFANVIVGLAVEFDGDSLGKECSKALPRCPAKFLADGRVGNTAVFLAPHQFSAEPRAHAAVRILNRPRHTLHGQRGVKMNRILQRRYVQTRLLLRIDAV